MSRKTKSAYLAVFKYIEENIFLMAPTKLMTDFENGMRSALKTVYPSAELSGCWFHMLQAIRRKCKTFKNFYKNLKMSSSKVTALYKKILLLPLLPAAKIVEAYYLLKIEADVNMVCDLFEPLFKYFKSHWLNKEKPEYFSVYKLILRTTSSVESNNKNLGDNFPKKGNFFRFVSLLQDEEYGQTNALAASIKNAKLSGPPRRKILKKMYAHRDEIIRESWALIEKDKLSSMQFLNR